MESVNLLDLPEEIALQIFRRLTHPLRSLAVVNKQLNRVVHDPSLDENWEPSDWDVPQGLPVKVLYRTAESLSQTGCVMLRTRQAYLTGTHYWEILVEHAHERAGFVFGVADATAQRNCYLGASSGGWGTSILWFDPQDQNVQSGDVIGVLLEMFPNRGGHLSFYSSRGTYIFGKRFHYPPGTKIYPALSWWGEGCITARFGVPEKERKIVLSGTWPS